MTRPAAGPVPTLVVDPPALEAGEARVEGEGYRHLFRAARLAVGDAVRLVDGGGRARWGRVARVDRRAGVIALGEEAPANEAPVAVGLFVAPPRPQRASWLVEKATEVGVAAVRFVAAERSPRGYGAGQLERLRRVACAAVEQCGRSRLPEVGGPHRVSELAPLLAPFGERWLLDPEAAFPGLFAATAPCALLVGPEGGWTAGERRTLTGDLGCRPAALGPRILRVETAAVVGAALLLTPRPPGAPEQP